MNPMCCLLEVSTVQSAHHSCFQDKLRCGAWEAVPQIVCSWITAVSDQSGSAGSARVCLMCCLCLLADVCENVSKLLGGKCHNIHRVNFLPGQCLVWAAGTRHIWSEGFWPVWLKVWNGPTFLLLVINSRYIPWFFQYQVVPSTLLLILCNRGPIIFSPSGLHPSVVTIFTLPSSNTLHLVQRHILQSSLPLCECGVLHKVINFVLYIHSKQGNLLSHWSTRTSFTYNVFLSWRSLDFHSQTRKIGRLLQSIRECR